MNIQGMDIEMMTSYKYLGVHLNHKLDWTDHTAAFYRKGLRSFGVQEALLKTSYDSVVASAIFFGVVCWASGILEQGERDWKD